MARPRTYDDTNLTTASLAIHPDTKHEAKEIAHEHDVSASSVLCLAVELGLPQVPKELKRRRKEQERAAREAKPRASSKPSNLVKLRSIAGGDEKPLRRLELRTYGLRNCCSYGHLRLIACDIEPIAELPKTEATEALFLRSAS